MPNDFLTDRIDSKTPATNGVSGLPEAEWNGLTDPVTPFVDWRFLAALERSDCLDSHAGWQPCPLIETDSRGRIKSAAPAYLKSHSHGEFVFDWAWARAAQGAGLAWYPKLLIAAPFSPVSGPRLLGAQTDPTAAASLIDQAEQRVERERLSSAGVNFCDDHDAHLLTQAGWLERFDWQFHWHNQDYRDFDDFLDHLKRKPRKNIRAERRKVAAEGWRFEWLDGTQLNDSHIEFADRCYQSTFALYGNLPMLNQSFFAHCARRFGPDFLICLAVRNNRAEAAAIFWRNDQRLYGRYWGSLVEARDVHFETCYYQGIEYCIRHGLTAFEPGAQGEHKIRRGFLPCRTRSFHYIRHPGLRHGIDRYLQAEAEALIGYREHLERLNPFGD
jgi:uncharacterized protein